uniref:Coiled-coil domain-containing protein 130 homolog n=1 Tax=Trichuris muris TaxID=70415 RepID=A0A5S6QFL2_TRIMR
MGERKGTNKYYPPDYDPRKGGLNKWQGTHALRERARKLHLGILIIRFEMPFNVWCEGCNNHIGMGVRYNAEKKKVGNYYSTPIYQFRMKCHLCDNHFEIKTDPKNFDYELVSGLRRQERRWNMAENEQVCSVDRTTSNKLSTDAMYKLEHGELDQAKLKSVAPELERLRQFKEKWKDDFALNQELRRVFRVRKKELRAQKEADDALRKKFSLAIPLTEESESDRKLATMIAQYRTSETLEESEMAAHKRIMQSSVFSSPSTSRRRSNSTPASSVLGSLSKERQIGYLKGQVSIALDKRKISKLDNELDGFTKILGNAVKPKAEAELQNGNGLDVLKCYMDDDSSGD